VNLKLSTFWSPLFRSFTRRTGKGKRRRFPGHRQMLGQWHTVCCEIASALIGDVLDAYSTSLVRDARHGELLLLLVFVSCLSDGVTVMRRFCMLSTCVAFVLTAVVAGCQRPGPYQHGPVPHSPPPSSSGYVPPAGAQQPYSPPANVNNSGVPDGLPNSGAGAPSIPSPQGSGTG
jgi:hypothetical protein